MSQLWQLLDRPNSLISLHLGWSSIEIFSIIWVILTMQLNQDYNKLCLPQVWDSSHFSEQRVQWSTHFVVQSNVHFIIKVVCEVKGKLAEQKDIV